MMQPWLWPDATPPKGSPTFAVAWAAAAIAGECPCSLFISNSSKTSSHKDSRYRVRAIMALRLAAAGWVGGWLGGERGRGTAAKKKKAREFGHGAAQGRKTNYR